MSIFDERPLKSVKIEDFERAIGDAVSTLIGKKYEARVSSIDFNPTNNAFLQDTVSLQLKLSQPLDFSGVSKGHAQRSGADA